MSNERPLGDRLPWRCRLFHPICRTERRRGGRLVYRMRSCDKCDIQAVEVDRA